MCGKAIPEIVCRVLTGLALLMQITALIIWPVLNSDTIGKNICFEFLVNPGYRKREIQNKLISFLVLSLFWIYNHLTLYYTQYLNSNIAPKFLFYRIFFLFLGPVGDTNPFLT